MILLEAVYASRKLVPIGSAGGWIGADMADGTTASSASAVIVAVVDIEEVIGGLEQRADAERKLQARAAKIQADGDAWKSRLSEAEQAMQTAEGSAAQREAIVAFKDLEFQYEAKMAYWNDILEKSASNCGNRFSTTLREEVRKISEARGWDVVVADDSSAEFFLLGKPPRDPIQTIHA